MALIAALIPESADRRVLSDAAPAHRFEWATDWRDLSRLVKRHPAAAAVADLHAERGKDGVLRIYRFAKRFPNTPILVWGELDGRDLFRLGKAGATDVVPGGDRGNGGLVGELLGDATADGVADGVTERLRGRIGEQGLALVHHAAVRISDGIQVPELASDMGMSVSTLERRCERWGLTTPGRLLLWLRIIYGLKWLQEPGRSVESVAEQLSYSSGAAFRRAIKVTVGGRPTPLRNPEGFQRALDGFVRECPGDDAYQRSKRS